VQLTASHQKQHGSVSTTQQADTTTVAQDHAPRQPRTAYQLNAAAHSALGASTALRSKRYLGMREQRAR
jgi:hypothetical protein